MSEQARENPSNPGEYRLGLALSGGGFRASFFHIGVLARLAELDLLRQVQVVSTVSGGSIVGALYYLYVRNLFQNPDKVKKQIQTEDYVQLVGDLQKHFEKAVRKNLRMRTFGNPFKNWKMYGRRYSRSDRIAELYTKFLYAPVVEEALRSTVPLSGLKIQPHDERSNFHPFRDEGDRTANDRRKDKVPVLIINTTTLNTGHNFQFTATWMGEPPPQGEQKDLDKNTRLRRAYYLGSYRPDQVQQRPLPDKYQKLPLGIAVAASAAVPGIFHPLALTDLYEEITPQLVDGGVHDNQGTEGLLDSDCTHLLVSDASGQMGDVPEPNARAGSVVQRSNDILMDRVREEEYEGLVLRQSTSKVHEFLLLHLKEGLQQQELTWIGGSDKPDPQVGPRGRTPYGVDQRVQRLLADIRTDLDSFTEVEAHALMADGYLMTHHLINDALRQRLDPTGTGKPLAKGHPWDFLKITDYLSDPQKDPRFVRQLDVGGSLFFKVWKLFPWLKWSGITLLTGLVIIFLYYLFTHPSQRVPGVQWVYEKVNTFGALGVTLLTLGLYGILYLLPRHLRWVLSLRGLPRRLALRAGLATFGSLGVWVHLLIFDKLFLWQGKVARLRK